MPDWENPVGYNKLIKISISNRLNFKIKYMPSEIKKNKEMQYVESNQRPRN